MLSSLPHVNENPAHESQMVTGAPPASGTLISAAPSSNPSHRPSGEKNGETPRRPPATGVTSSRSAYRTIRPAREEYANTEPSGAYAIGVPRASLTATLSGRTIAYRSTVGGTSAGRRC